jgi:hypothetical protein
MYRFLITLFPLLIFLTASPSCTKKSSKKSEAVTAPEKEPRPLPPSQSSPSLADSERPEGKDGDKGDNPSQSESQLPKAETVLALSPDLLEKNSKQLSALYRPIAGKVAWNPKSIRVDPILEWNEIMLEANARDHAQTRPDQGGPTRTARAFAITHLAMHDAYNSVVKTSASYLDAISSPPNTNAAIAASMAAYVSLRFLYPSQTSLFDQAMRKSLSHYSYGIPEYNGLLLGKFAALRLLVDRQDDGSEVTGRYDPSGQAGTHDVDPLNPTQGFLDPAWGSVRPFAIPNTLRFAADRPPSLRSREYANAYAELVRLGGDGVTTHSSRTPEQTVIGIYWGYDGTPGLGTPPRLYNQIARTIADLKKNGVAENARLFALLNMAIADATIQCWADKYAHVFWRPIRGIRFGDQDGNPSTEGNPKWVPLGAQASNTRNSNFTPNFPSYTSGHAVLGAAGMSAIRAFYGTDRIAFTFVSDELNGITRGSDGQVRPRVPRSFTNMTQAIRENAESRLYLGIHWRFDLEAGIQSGLGIGEFVVDNQLRPLSAQK